MRSIGFVVIVVLAACKPEPQVSLEGITIVPATPTVVDALTLVLPGDVDPTDVRIRWRVDGQEVAEGATLAAGSALRGSTVDAVATAGDVTETAAAVVVLNSLPVLADLSLTPAAPDPDDDVVATYAATDADGDTLILTRTWQVDHTLAEAAGDTLPASAHHAHAAVEFTLRVEDGHGGLVERTAATTVTSYPPSTPAVAIYPDAPYVDEQNVVCLIDLEATDPDGDEVSYTFTWTRDGSPLTTGIADTLRPGDTVLASTLVAGATYACQAVATDGAAASGAATSGESVPHARVPVAIEQSFTGLCLRYDDGSVTCAGLLGSERLDDTSDYDWTAFSLTQQMLCGLNRTGRLECDSASTVTEPTTEYVAMAGRDEEFALLRPDGTLDRWEHGHGHGLVDGKFSAVWGSMYGLCGLHLNGVLECFDTPGDVQDGAPADIVDLAIGFEGACAILPTGELSCWDGAPTPPAGDAWVEVVAGSSGFCARDDVGAVSCWPASASGTPPAGVTFIDLDGSERTLCGLDTDGVAHCWGSETGHVPMPSQGTVRGLLMGSGRYCYEDFDGAWRCDRWSRPTTFDTTGLTGLAVDELLCGLTSTGDVRCLDERDVPLADVPGPFVHVASSSVSEYACALDAAGRSTCWGEVPDELPPLGLKFLALHTGGCGLDMQGHPLCWGGLLDSGSAQAPESDTFVSIALGEDAACGLRENGTLGCWGGTKNGFSTLPGNPWKAATPAGKFTSVAYANANFCATRMSGEIECWSRRAADPVATPPEGRWLQLGSSSSSWCAVSVDGHTACWGDAIR